MVKVSAELEKILGTRTDEYILEAIAFYSKYRDMGIDIERKSRLIDARNKVILKKMEFLKQAFIAVESLDLGIKILKEEDEIGGE
jgi:hypothetical protein